MADHTLSDSPQEDASETAAHWLVAAILIAAVVITAFYFFRDVRPTPEIPNMGADIELAPAPPPGEGASALPQVE